MSVTDGNRTEARSRLLQLQDKIFPHLRFRAQATRRVSTEHRTTKNLAAARVNSPVVGMP